MRRRRWVGLQHSSFNMEAPHFGIRLARAVSWHVRCLEVWCYQQRLPCGHAGLSGRRRGEPRTKHTPSSATGRQIFRFRLSCGWVIQSTHCLCAAARGGVCVLCRETIRTGSLLSNRGRRRKPNRIFAHFGLFRQRECSRATAYPPHTRLTTHSIPYYPTYHNPNVRTPHSRRIRASRAVPLASHNDYDKAGSTTTARRARVSLERRHAHRRWHRLRVVVVERVERC